MRRAVCAHPVLRCQGRDRHVAACAQSPGRNAPGVRVVVAANGFTTEGKEALTAAEALIVALGDYPWTDESYLAVHVR